MLSYIVENMENANTIKMGNTFVTNSFMQNDQPRLRQDTNINWNQKKGF